ncbi:PPOX class probable F420-dependent enzyme [Jatrophihabitans endophyticus]|uniref:PPOX class probable F420-dependent enzyme n=2 Tax=Jatrophihabitans endophyticus TaxID=1206085 RepID=A0A1M5TAM2_9ACTN|nr:PPOX class probable F420-dependent enzyme [Jatrophihabitans endophyticus]
MSDERRREFLSAGTRTAILSTVRKDGTPHAAPIWFVLDGDVVVFTTGEDTVKGRNLRRTGVATVTVDEAAPPFSFVTLTGDVEIVDDPDALLQWATRLGGRYMGEAAAEQFGRRNAVPGELLVRLTPRRVTAQDAVAD